MSHTATKTRVRDRIFDAEILGRPAAVASTRRIVFQTRGNRHGPVTRLVSPSDIGELIKPFVFLDHAEVPFTGRKLFGIHPHSGIATITGSRPMDRQKSGNARLSAMSSETNTPPGRRASHSLLYAHHLPA